MKNLLLKFWLKLHYHIDCQWVGDFKSKDQPVMLIRPWTSQLDPLLCKLYWKSPRRKRILASLPRIQERWILRFLKPCLKLPVFTFKTPMFYRKRLEKALRNLEEKEDLIVMYEGVGNPVVSMVLAKNRQRDAVLVKIEGMEGSPLSLLPGKKSLQKWIMRRRKVKITFIDLADRLTPETKPEEIDEWMQSVLLQQKVEEEMPPSTAPLIAEIARLSEKPISAIEPGMHLYDDLGLDSLDVTEIVVFLEQNFQRQASFHSLEKVKDVLEAAQTKGAKPTKALDERQKWSQSRPGIKQPEGKTIAEAFLNVCERMGSSLACADHLEIFSYLRLKSLALGLVGRLKQVPGESIGILLPPSGETYAIILGLFLAQKRVVMLNSTLGPKHLDEVIQSAGLKAILTTSQVMEHLAWDISDEIEGKIILLEEMRRELSFEERREGLRLARKTPEELSALLGLDQLTGEEIAVILFTSGTEKSPKGVPLSHQNLLSNHRDICEAVLFKEEDVLLGILPAFHVYGFSMTGLFPLLTGLRVLFHPSPLDLQGIAHQVHQWGATVIATAPTFLKHFLLVAPADSLATVRLLIVGAEKTPADLRSLVEQKAPGAQLLEGYGLTECSPVLTLSSDGESSCVGRPLRHVQLLIVDPETHMPLPERKEGLIVVKGPNVFGGYLHADQQPFVKIKGEKWFITQDMGSVDRAGRLYLVGRMSRTVKIGAEMISLAFVEDLLLKGLGQRFPSLQIAIMGEEDGRKGAHLILYANQALLVEEVNHLLHEGGASNLLKVREVRVLPVLPMTALGKIDYKKLK
jgi:acyl carrier protein